VLAGAEVIHGGLPGATACARSARSMVARRQGEFTVQTAAR
jgi:hypothetical protein